MVDLRTRQSLQMHFSMVSSGGQLRRAAEQEWIDRSSMCQRLNGSSYRPVLELIHEVPDEMTSGALESHVRIGAIWICDPDESAGFLKT
jgi:hypothetical protein